MASLIASKVIRDAAVHLDEYLAVLEQASVRGAGGSRPGRPGPTAAAVRGVATPPATAIGADSAPPSMQPMIPPEVAAGNALIDALVRLFMCYQNLTDQQFKSNGVIRGALVDVFGEILNPEHWSNTGSLAASALRARGAVLMSASRLPSVLLSRDAGAKATAPLAALSERYRCAATVDMHLLLATYVDHLCQREPSSGGEVAQRAPLIALFSSLLDSKDIFLEHYKVRLARRLLGTTISGAANLAVERWLLQQLQLRLGVGATNSFEAMVRDCDSTTLSDEAFRQTPEYLRLDAKTRVQVLTSAQWPSYRMISLNVHASLQQGMDAFKAFYCALHPSRTLRWVHTLGSAVLIGEFPRGSKEIIANTLQATILLVLSDTLNGPSKRGEDGAPAEVLSPQAPAALSCGSSLRGMASGGNSGPWIPTPGGVVLSGTPSPFNDSLLTISTGASATPTSTSLRQHHHQQQHDDGDAKPSARVASNLTLSALNCAYTEDSSSMSFYSINSASSPQHTESSPLLPKQTTQVPSHPTFMRGQDIADTMGIPFDELRPHLRSMVQHRLYSLIQRVGCDHDEAVPHHQAAGRQSQGVMQGMSQDTAAPLEATDHFAFNPGFTHKLRRVKLPVPRLRTDAGFANQHMRPGEKAGGADSEGGARGGSVVDVKTVVTTARKHQLDAAVVRIMKSRRVLSYQELLNSTIQQVSNLFLPTTRDVKVRIEDLVGRGFLRRGDDGTGMIEYLA